MDELPFCSAGVLADALRRRELSCREALEHYLDRIERLNSPLNAVIATNPQAARERADEADKALAAGRSWGPLHGLPVTIKDSYEVAGMATVCGAPVLKDHRPKNNAVAVQRLIDAGAVVFGKTNTPLFAQDIQTFNKVFGTTNNPWDAARTPGGSSGGAATAVAAGFTAFELGSDIGGSIRTPAHFCGVYGHKPSHGIIPLRGHIPGPPGTLSEPDLAVAGPLGRSAGDLALLLDILVGPGELDASAWRLELPPPRHESLADYRVACWFDDDYCPVDAETKRLLDETAQALVDAGAKVERQPKLPATLEDEFELYEYLLDAVIGAGLPSRAYKGLSRIAGPLRWLGRDKSGRMGRFANAASASHRSWARLNEAREQRRRAWQAFFADYDVLLTPVTPTAAVAHNQKGNLFSRKIEVDGEQRRYFEQFVWIGPATTAYLPATTAPMALTGSGLPVGMQIVGNYLEDKTTIDFARQLAPLTGGFKPPPL